jgi:hypothetical protein
VPTSYPAPVPAQRVFACSAVFEVNFFAPIALARGLIDELKVGR